MRLLIPPLLLFALSAPAAAANGGLYRCHALDAVSIQADGKLGHDNIDSASAKPRPRLGMGSAPHALGGAGSLGQAKPHGRRRPGEAISGALILRRSISGREDFTRA